MPASPSTWAAGSSSGSEATVISIIIPVLNGGEGMRQCLEAISRQETSEEYEIVVVDSGSTDGTQDLARSFGARVHEIPPHEFNHGGTRNTGAELAEGDTLVFTVDDALPVGNNWLEDLTRPLRSENDIAATCGRQVAHEDATPPQGYYIDYRYGPEARINRASSDEEMAVVGILLSNVSSAMRREIWEQYRFSPDIMIAEDWDLARRVLLDGHAIAYVPEAVVKHSHRYSLPEAFRRYFDLGVSSEHTMLAEGAAASGRVRRSGVEFVKDELKWLWSSGRRRWIPYTVAFEATRFIGFRLGTRYQSLPHFLLRRWSRLPIYWSDEARAASAERAEVKR